MRAPNCGNSAYTAFEQRSFRLKISHNTKSDSIRAMTFFPSITPRNGQFEAVFANRHAGSIVGPPLSEMNNTMLFSINRFRFRASIILPTESSRASKTPGQICETLSIGFFWGAIFGGKNEKKNLRILGNF